MNDYKFWYTCNAGQIASLFKDGFRVAFSSLGIVQDKMLMIGTVFDTNIVIFAFTPLVAKDGCILSKAYAKASRESGYGDLAFKFVIADEKYYSKEDSDLCFEARDAGADFDATYRMYSRACAEFVTPNQSDLVSLGKEFSFVCDVFDIRGAVPAPPPARGVYSGGASTNSKLVFAEFVKSVAVDVVRDEFTKEIESHVRVAIEIVAARYLGLDPFELLDAMINGRRIAIDLSDDASIGNMVEKGKRLLDRYSVDLKKMFASGLDAFNESLKISSVAVSESVDRDDLLCIYMCLEHVLSEEKKALGSVVGINVVELWNVRPVEMETFGKFSMD